MNPNRQQSEMYEKLLYLPDLSLQKIQEMNKRQDNAVFKSLLKIQASNRIADHRQAISELKLAHSTIVNFMRSSTSEQSEMIYRKVVTAVLSHMINRLLAAKRYKEAMQQFQYLINQQLISLPLVRQAIYNMFGVSSLVALDGYNYQSNAQFKYPSQTQIQFFYLLGKVKMVTKKMNEARIVLQKILMMSRTAKVSDYLMLRVLDLLVETDPSKYRLDKQKATKSSKPQNVLSQEQKQSHDKIIKELLNKELQFSTTEEEKWKINNKMMGIYFNRLFKQRKNSQNLTQKHQKALIQSLIKENNQTVLKQVQETGLWKQAGQFFITKIQNVQKILLTYYFRKLLKMTPSRIKTTEIATFKEGVSQVKISQPLKTKSIRSTVPLDIERAKQILKKCSKGSHLMKVNYGNSSVVQRYVRILEKALVWGNEVQDTDSSSSACKWKHVLGITYGKVSENLAKEKFWKLEPWQCFSLITKDRSFDFYCENQSDIFFWLQGISFQLQIFHKNANNYPFYSKGRALWRMCLLKMGWKYNDPKKKYKCKNAGSVIGFQKLRRL